MLVWALVAFVIVAGVVFAGGRSLRATASDTETRFRREGQAQDVARAGLVDAYAWFRRQSTQPVTTFAPQRDLGGGRRERVARRFAIQTQRLACHSTERRPHDRGASFRDGYRQPHQPADDHRR